MRLTFERNLEDMTYEFSGSLSEREIERARAQANVLQRLVLDDDGNSPVKMLRKLSLVALILEDEVKSEEQADV